MDSLNLPILFTAFGFFALGFITGVILAVPRIPQWRNADEYIRESLKPFQYLFNKDIKNMQELYDTTAHLVDELKEYREEGT